MYYETSLESLAAQFVLALRAGKPARMPAIRFSQWPPFMAIVKQIQGECT
ncbi:succinate dehydrogenase flavoprotein subunit [Candidatus Pantoea bituminis]|nr:succinate dehydrogenase flavoprotein subunit [Pantoea bituminis]